MKNIFCLIIILLLSWNLEAGAETLSTADVAVEARVMPGKATVGAVLEYYVLLTGPASGSFDLLLPQERAYFKPEKDEGETSESADSVPLYIIGSASRKDSGQGEESVSEIKIEITYYRPGIYTLPGFKIKDRSGIELSYQTPEVEIAAINPEGGFTDIESPLDLSGNYRRVLYLVVAALILGGALFFLYRVIKSRQKDGDESVLPVPPIDAFLAGIKEMNAPSLIAGGDVKSYVFAVSLLFRRYISALYSFDAAEMTTEEISRKLGHVMLQEDLKIFRNEIVDIMSFWDLSKFAEFAPSEELLLNNFESTVALAHRLNHKRGSDNE